MNREKLLKTAKPILFNTEMVQAILEGRKKQFRILIPPKYQNTIPDSATEIEKLLFAEKVSKFYLDDVLYVRETFTLGKKEIIKPENVWYIRNDLGKNIFYKTDLNDDFYDPDSICKWKPSIHMPKEYARIFLKITNVRVERLQDLNKFDLEKEGFKYSLPPFGKPEYIAFKEFDDLWNSTAKEGYKLEDNPYVFVYDFERISLD